MLNICGWVWVCVMIYNFVVCDIIYDILGVCLKEVVFIEIYVCYNL